MSEFDFGDSPLEMDHPLGTHLGIRLFIQRDDLLPFPLAGNKVRKLAYEARSQDWQRGDVLITNGGVDSNHCRTLAFMAARLGARAHLVLHGGQQDEGSPALRLLAALGATFDVVSSEEIAPTIARVQAEQRAKDRLVHIIPGGAHTPAGVEAYRDVGLRVMSAHQDLDHVVLASGTGATHAGLHIAAIQLGATGLVTGISVARHQERGLAAVVEAVSWVEPSAARSVQFDARFVDGGYGRASRATREAVDLAWQYGLPLDATYTGKAMRGLREMVREGTIAQGSRVLFWHTGGLMNHLTSLTEELS